MSAPHCGSLREHYPADADLEPAEATVNTHERTTDDYDDWDPFEGEDWLNEEPEGDADEAEAFHARIAGRA